MEKTLDIHLQEYRDQIVEDLRLYIQELKTGSPIIYENSYIGLQLARNVIANKEG